MCLLFKGHTLYDPSRDQQQLLKEEAPGDGVQPGPHCSGTALLCGALDCGKDMSTKVRAFSRREPGGFLRPLGKGEQKQIKTLREWH